MEVGVTGSLRSAVDDVASIEIQARTIRELLSKLVERYPRLGQHVDEGIAVSIDGEIYRDDWSIEIPADSEVFLLPRIQGG